MAPVSTDLTFRRTTEEALDLYRSVLQTDYPGPIARFREMPTAPGQPPLAAADEDLVLHVELPILRGHILMGTDTTESTGVTVAPGDNVYINLEPDTRAETDRLFTPLAEGGAVQMPRQEMFWGGCFGSTTDRFGIRWMIDCASRT